MRGVTAGRLLILLASVVVAGTIGAALMLVGSPADERVRQSDRRRVADLVSIGQAADRYWTRHRRLATSIDEVGGEGGSTLATRDPETSEPYEYRVLSDKAYELCARFQRDSAADGLISGGDFWAHGAGRQCFRLEARNIAR
jgi:hypothetical protein